MKIEMPKVAKDLLGKTSVLYCSCDSIYFREHASILAASAQVNKTDLHINVVNADRGAQDFLLAGVIERSMPYVTVSFSTADLTGVDARTYFSCDRFITASAIMEHVERVMIIDADCLIMSPVNWSAFENADYSLFTRDPLPGTTGIEHIGTKVAAGCVYAAGDKGRRFLETVSDTLRRSNLRWFIDQYVLWSVHEKWQNADIIFKQVPDEFIDWDFRKDTTIWTGKGPRKYENPQYLEAKAQYERIYETIIKGGAIASLIP